MQAGARLGQVAGRVRAGASPSSGHTSTGARARRAAPTAFPQPGRSSAQDPTPHTALTLPVAPGRDLEPTGWPATGRSSWRGRWGSGLELPTSAGAGSAPARARVHPGRRSAPGFERDAGGAREGARGGGKRERKRSGERRTEGAGREEGGRGEGKRGGRETEGRGRRGTCNPTPWAHPLKCLSQRNTSLGGRNVFVFPCDK